MTTNLFAARESESVLNFN